MGFMNLRYTFHLGIVRKAILCSSIDARGQYIYSTKFCVELLFIFLLKQYYSGKFLKNCSLFLTETLLIN